MKTIFKSKWLLISSIATCVIGFFLQGSASDPDLTFSASQEVGTYFVFLWFTCCTLGWGFSILCLLDLSGLGLLGSLATGSIFLSLMGFIYGHLGLIGYQFFPLIFNSLFFGPVLYSYLDLQKARPAKVVNTSGRLNIGIGAVSTICLAAVVLSFLKKPWLLHAQTDAFIYHLTAPRMWVDQGYISLPKHFPIAYQCSWWEMMIVLSQNILGGPGGLGLIEGQLFGQFLHSTFGLAGCVLALYGLARTISQSLSWIALALMLSLASPELRLYSSFAKNDWGVMLWVLAATVFLLRPLTPDLAELNFSSLKAGKWSEKILIGILMGFAIAGKINMVFFVASVLGLWSFTLFSRVSASVAFTQIAPIALGLLLGTLPIFIRNGLSTGNPFYPFFDTLTSPDLLALNAVLCKQTHCQAKWGLSLELIRKQFLFILKDSPSHFSLFLLPFFVPFVKSRIFRTLIFATILSSLWFFTLDAFNPFIRWLGIPLILSGFLFILGIESLIPKTPNWNRAGLTIALLAILGLTPCLLDPSLKLVFWNHYPANLAIRDPRIHMGADSKAWIRLNANYSTPIVTTGDNQIYYITSYSVSSMSEDPVESMKVSWIKNPETLLSELYLMGFRIILDTDHWLPYEWSPTAVAVHTTLGKFPQAILFQGMTSRIVDLRILNEQIHQACFDEATLLPGLRLE